MKRNLEYDQTKKHFCSSGCADYSSALLVPGFGRLDGFLHKGACPCKTLQRDHCGREERPSAYKSYGAAVEGWQIPNSPETKFEIASLSKQFTAGAILKLADAGKLNVEDPVSKYYPESPPA